MKIKTAVFLLAFLQAAFIADAQDDRSKSLDFIIILDKSLSMAKKMDDVKDFFTREILDKQIKTGDSLLLMGFYGQTEVLTDSTINSDEDRAVVRQVLGKLKGDGRYTDIGAAVDFVASYVKTHPRTGDRQHFILLTDGIQEAPPGSPYFGPKGFITHQFLDNAKTIARSGWKIQILGLGTETAAQDLALELGGTAKVWTDSEALVQDTSVNFAETLGIDSSPELINESGRALLRIKARAKDLNQPRTLSIESIGFSTKSGEISLLDAPWSVKIAGSGVHILDIPLKDTAATKISGEKGELIFRFSGDLPLVPGNLEVTFPRVDSVDSTSSQEPFWEFIGFKNREWWALGLAGLGALFLIYFIIRLIRSRKSKDREDSLVP